MQVLTARTTPVGFRPSLAQSVPKFVKRSISYGDNQKIVDLNQRILQYVALSTTGWAHYAAFEKKFSL